jgi:hypothetical protein
MLAVATTLPPSLPITVVAVAMDANEGFDADAYMVEPVSWLARGPATPEAADILPILLSAVNTGAVFVLRSAGACAMAAYPIRVYSRCG